MRFKLPVVLASASPRRRELLSALTSDFEILAADLDERLYEDPNPTQTALKLAEAKARKIAELRPQALIIGSDTVVVVRHGLVDHQLSKPDSQEDAEKMLAMLSGCSHRVITGVALIWPQGEKVFAETTTVTFREIDRQEIEAYVATGESLDKAGAYAIQGGAAPFVKWIQGSETNVIGLPMEALTVALKKLA